jgi:hypothetical protein
MNYNRRLRTIARQLGCPIHGTLPYCPTCQPLAPLPAALSTGIGELIDAIVARVGVEAIRAVCLRAPRPPAYGPCARCGTPRQCGACEVRYNKQLFRAIGLTAAEEAQIEGLMALGRALER